MSHICDSMVLTTSGESLKQEDFELNFDVPSIQKDNASWVSDALSAGKDVQGPRDIPEAGVAVTTLPANTTFVSLLGPRFRVPGSGGECRFAFDPPLQAYSLSRNDEGRLNYTYVDQGNPHFINLSYGGVNVSFTDPTKPNGKDDFPSTDYNAIEKVALLNQQLDPRVQYKMAVLNGPLADSLIDNGVDRISGESCVYGRAHAWVVS